jgi:GNAT superfamily N-acetyltransferase
MERTLNNPIYRLAHEADAASLTELCARWHCDQVVTTERGFLGATFSAETFQQLAAAGHCVVADLDGELLGYYLCNPFTKDGVLNLHHDRVALCRQAGAIPTDARVGVGGQALVDAPFQGQGIRENLLHLLIIHLQGQYDYLFGTISKENPRAFRAHTKDGWQVKHEDEQYWSVFYPVSTPS